MHMLTGVEARKILYWTFFFSFLFLGGIICFETESCCVHQVGFKLTMSSDWPRTCDLNASASQVQVYTTSLSQDFLTLVLVITSTLMSYRLYF
jgi:hypothetical protein